MLMMIIITELYRCHSSVRRFYTHSYTFTIIAIFFSHIGINSNTHNLFLSILKLYRRKKIFPFAAEINCMKSGEFLAHFSTPEK